jgi:hypothetical protein
MAEEQKAYEAKVVARQKILRQQQDDREREQKNELAKAATSGG